MAKNKGPERRRVSLNTEDAESMMKGIYSRRGVSDLLAKDEKMDAKLAKHKADTIKFMLSTPPPATVEVTGIYTDRTHGAKVSTDLPSHR